MRLEGCSTRPFGRVVFATSIGLAIVALVLLVYIVESKQKTGQVAFEFVQFKQPVKGGAVFLEFRLTNGTENVITYWTPNGEDSIRFLPLIRERNPAGWSNPHGIAADKGTIMVQSTLMPHESKTALSRLEKEIGEHCIGIQYRIPNPPPRGRLSLWFEIINSRVRPIIGLPSRIVVEDLQVWSETVINPPATSTKLE